MQALGFPSSQKNQQPHFPEVSFPYTQGVEGMQSVNAWLLTFFQRAGWTAISFSHGGTQLL